MAAHVDGASRGCFQIQNSYPQSESKKNKTVNKMAIKYLINKTDIKNIKPWSTDERSDDKDIYNVKTFRRSLWGNDNERQLKQEFVEHTGGNNNRLSSGVNRNEVVNQVKQTQNHLHWKL